MLFKINRKYIYIYIITQNQYMKDKISIKFN